MFQRTKFTSIDANGDVASGEWDTSGVTNMSNMFYFNRSLTSIDVGDFDTSSVTTFGSMFYYCNVLTSLDISSFSTESATNFYMMFGYMRALNTFTFDKNKFTLENATTISYMFYYFPVTTLDVSQMDPGSSGGNFNNMYGAFYYSDIILLEYPHTNILIS